MAHTATGRLPVTEQTDGVDIDRLPPSPPQNGKSDPSNRSPDAPMVEMVLGTVVGNDPFKGTSVYRKPLKVERGQLVEADPSDVESHLAFLVRVNNPIDPNAAPSFFGMTKGGAWKKSTPGRGSASSEEFFGSGHQMEVGADEAGGGLGVQSKGAINLVNTGGGNATNNFGVNIESAAGAVNIQGSGASSEGAGQGVGTEAGGSTLAAQQIGLRLGTDRSSLWESALTSKIKCQTFVVDENDTTTINTNTQFGVQSGGGVSLEGKTLDFNSNGKMSITAGGPKDGLLTNGSPFSIGSIANPATGFPGGEALGLSALFGNILSSVTTVGQVDSRSQVGGVSLASFGLPAIIPSLPIPGVSSSFGLPGIGSRTDVGPLGVVGTAFQGLASLTALAGAATITSTIAASVTGAAQVAITGGRVSVFCAGLPGAVLTDMCFDSLTGMPFMFGGTIGTPGFRVNS